MNQLESGDRRNLSVSRRDYLLGKKKVVEFDSGYEANIVNQATQNGNAHNLCTFDIRLQNIWRRVRYSSNSLVRPTRVVVIHEFSKGSYQVAFIEENKMVKAFGLKRLNYALAKGACFGRTVGGGDAAYPHRFKEPLVQVAPEGATCFISGKSELAKDAIIVVDQKFGFLLKSDAALETVLNEIQSRVVCNSEVNDLAGFQMHENKDGQHFKVDQGLLKEVTAKNALGFLGQEGAPSATGCGTGVFHHVLTNSPAGHDVAKFNFELQGDAFGSPSRVFSRK